MKAALRLRRPSDFARARRSGAVYRHSHLLLSLRRSELPRNRYGIVTSKRLGNAVVRNRCKRRLRAILSDLHCEMRQGFDIVVVARRPIAGQPFSEISRILKCLLTRARVMGNG